MASNSAWRGACTSGPDFMSDPPRPRTEVHTADGLTEKTNTRRWLNKSCPESLARHPYSQQSSVQMITTRLSRWIISSYGTVPSASPICSVLKPEILVASGEEYF